MPQSDFQRQVLRILHIMRLAQQEQGDLLHEVSRQRVHSDPIVAEAPLVPTPFASCEALVDFNDSLNEHMETRLVEELAQLGGSEVRQSTRKILEYLLTDYVAAEFSWLGQKGKRKFGQLKLPQLIIRHSSFRK
uniref:Putative secreted protein n=1 Tax=Ornithodoros turicata TaxID=34597 RepID=A0A2R5L443_9ACAR